MKKIFFLLIALGLLVSMAACSATQASVPSTDTTTAVQATPAAGRQMGAETTLLIGTFLLEDTPQAVTPEQAQQLILLWKAVKSMSSADNVAQAELDALYTQIKEAMSADQITAINGMTIDGQTMRDLMTKLGVDFAPNGFGANQDSSSPNFGDLPEGGPPEGFSGGMPGGGPGEGGGGGPGGGGMFSGDGQQLTESQRATMVAGRDQSGSPRSFGMNLVLIDPLIQLLQERAAQ